MDPHLVERLANIKETATNTNVYVDIRRMEREKHNRIPLRASPTVVELWPDEFGTAEIGLPPGSIALIFAKKESRKMQMLLDAYIGGDFESLQSLNNILLEEGRDWESGIAGDLTDSVIESPMFFDFRYGGKTLASNIGLSQDSEIGGIILPYNGGDLDNDNFSIAEFVTPRLPGNGQDPCGGPDPCLECNDYLLIKTHPHLSELEREVLYCVPPDSHEMNIGSTPSVANTTTLAVVVVYALINVTVAKYCEVYDSLSQTQLSREQVDEFGGLATVAELISARRRILEGLEMQ